MHLAICGDTMPVRPIGFLADAIFRRKAMSVSTESNPSCCAIKTRLFKFVAIPLVAAGLGFGSFPLFAAEGKKVPEQNSKGHFNVHDMTRPKPVVVTPGTF